MTPVPDVQPLPHAHRRIIFLCSLVIFTISVPLLVFYAIGYRFDFSGEVSNIKSVGGIYVTSDVRNIEIYIDDEPVSDMRIFQNAAYIQNLDANLYEVHTQHEGLQTWVKRLPVFPYFVTEVQSFNMPKVPQIRLITQYKTDAGDMVVFEDATTTTFAFASTTNTFFRATSTATSTFVANPEFVYIQTLFASSSEEQQLLQKKAELEEQNRFRFSSIPMATSTIQATTTKIWNDMKLYERDGEVYAQWVGKNKDIPYYFCINATDATSTTKYYGKHVSDVLYPPHSTTTEVMYANERTCRTEIRIDRLWQSVQWFDFFPGSRDRVLLQLQDGVYVVEVDDRAWQNTQLLYPGDYLQVVLDGGRIFIKDDEYYLEVFTEVQQ